MSRDKQSKFCRITETNTGARSAIVDQLIIYLPHSDGRDYKRGCLKLKNKSLPKNTGGFSGLKKSLTDGFTKVTGGSGMLVNLLEVHWPLFCTCKVF